LQIVRAIRERFARGRFDVTVIETTHEETPRRLRVNRALAREYLQTLRALKDEFGLPGEVTLEMLASQRDLFEVEGEEPGTGEAEWPELREALEGAMNALAAMRGDEGKSLEAALLGHLDLVDATLEAIAARAPEVVQGYRARLESRLQHLLDGKAAEPGRLEQEVAILADRSDVTEEIARMRSHIRQFRAFIEQPGPHGRRMEFLLQEMQREANTIGAKAGDATISREVVTLKGILEQLREQVQNVE
jgi:uncharacterized protein (TIGR00255 family)